MEGYEDVPLNTLPSQRRDTQRSSNESFEKDMSQRRMSKEFSLNDNENKPSFIEGG